MSADLVLEVWHNLTTLDPRALIALVSEWCGERPLRPRAGGPPTRRLTLIHRTLPSFVLAVEMEADGDPVFFRPAAP